MCSVIMVLLIFRAFLVRPPKKRRGKYLSKAFSFLCWDQAQVVCGCSTYFGIIYIQLSFACKFHAIFAPPTIPPNPNHFAHLWQSPKNKNKKRRILQKVRSRGGPFSQRNIKTLQKKKNEKKRHSLCVMKRNERARKNQVSLAGDFTNQSLANLSKRPQQKQ